MTAIPPPVLGNPDLEPEKIKTYEASLGYRFGNSYTINVNYFYNDIDDLILLDTSDIRYMNMGGAEVDGVEVILSGKYSPANYWQLSYIRQNPEDADTGEALPNVPSHRAALSVNYEICKYLNAHADMLWTDSKTQGIRRFQMDDMPPIPLLTLALIAKNFYERL